MAPEGLQKSYLQIGRIIEALVASCTDMRTLAPVPCHVRPQSVSTVETFITDGAFVCFLFKMGLPVTVQQCFGRESPLAHRTGRLLNRALFVSSHVHFQHPRALK